jgi:hypothetical protein
MERVVAVDDQAYAGHSVILLVDERTGTPGTRFVHRRAGTREGLAEAVPLVNVVWSAPHEG